MSEARAPTPSSYPLRALAQAITPHAAKQPRPLAPTAAHSRLAAARTTTSTATSAAAVGDSSSSGGVSGVRALVAMPVCFPEVLVSLPRASLSLRPLEPQPDCRPAAAPFGGLLVGALQPLLFALTLGSDSKILKNKSH